MSVRSFFVGIVILVAACIAGAQESGPKPHSNAAASGQASENACLGCHGPFQKLTEASAKYVAPSGEKGSPHRYVPHDSKKDADIPECSHCHTAHPLDPLPAAGSIDLSKVSVQWCYDACHHEKNLTSCKQCHP